jgi:hypothetical protein
MHQLRARLQRLSPLLAAAALLIAMVVISRDFGATWDERALQRYGEDLWEYYSGQRPRSAVDVSFGYTRIYGGFVELTSVAVQHLIPANTYVVRHAVNSVFGWTGVVFAFLMALRLFGRRAGWIAAVLLIAMPRYVGESMNNTKDLPFAVLMLVGLYYIVTITPRYPYASWSHALKLALVIALALDVRVMGLVLVGYAGLGLLVAVIASGERSPGRLFATLGRFAIIAVLAIVCGTLFWPWAQEQPLVRPVQAFFLASTFSWGNPSLFAGRDLAAADLPWYYLPTWLAISLPPVVLVGLALSGSAFWRRPTARVQLAAVWAFVLLPATLAIVKHLSLYDGIRHMYFIVPPLAVIAAAGWDAALASVGAWPRIAAAAALVVGLAEPLLFQVRNHPNQNVYFSPFVGGPRGAFGRFDMDYWGNCVLQALDWSAAQAKQAGMPLTFIANAREIAQADVMRYRLLYLQLRPWESHHLDVRLLKGSQRSVVGVSGDPRVVHRVTTADGTPLCVVLRGPDYGQFEARLDSVSAAGPSR